MTRQVELTKLLQDWRGGDEALLDQIVPAVYDDLHKLASRFMRKQSGPQTLQATALINEAFCRLDSINIDLQDRGHFISICARLMRQILVDHARAKGSQKRGGDAVIVPFEEANVASQPVSIDILAINEVLDVLEKSDPRKVQIAELHYFCGATYKETAEALGISQSTLHRELTMTKALLAHALGDR